MANATPPRTKTLVIGASGFVGRHLLAGLGEEAIGTWHTVPLPTGLRFDATRDRLADILPAGTTFDQAVLLFAEPKIDPCKEDPARTEALNVVAPVRVTEELVHLGIRPIFTSSEYVFDGRKGGYTEVDEPCPNTAYGRQKLATERSLQSISEDIAILRLAKVVGTDLGDGSLLPEAARQLAEGEAVQVARDQVFSPIFAGDVVQAVRAVIKARLDGLYHVAGPASFSRFALVRMLADRLPGPREVIEVGLDDLSFADERPKDLSLDAAKLMTATGLRFRGMAACCRDVASKISALHRAGTAHSWALEPESAQVGACHER